MLSHRDNGKMETRRINCFAAASLQHYRCLCSR